MTRPGYAPASTAVDEPTPLPPLTDVAVFVPGKPVPKGDLEVVNLRAVRAGRQPVLRPKNAKALEGWVRQIRGALAVAGHLGQTDYTGALIVWCGFVLERPKTLDRVAHDPYHTSRRGGDCDKLLRAVLDAVTGVLCRDDAQAYIAPPEKRYARRGEAPGVHLRAKFMERVP